MKGIKFLLCTLVLFYGMLCGEVCGQTGGKYTGEKSDGFARSSVNFGVKLVNFPTELCAGVDTALNAEVICVDNPASYRVEWFKLNPAGSMGVAKRIVLSPLALADAGSYYCKVTNKAGVSVYSDTMHLQVNEMPVAKIIQPSDREIRICWGDTLSVMGSSSVADAKLKWRGKNIVGADTSVLIDVAPLEQTDYIFRADNRRCWTEDTLTVKIDRPFVDIPSVVNVTEGSPLLLTAVDTVGNALAAAGLTWKIKPSMLVGTNVNPLSLGSVEKDMVVEVTLKSGGCSATDSTRVLVKGAGAFHGGPQDGFARTCLPPVILVQPYAGENQCVMAAKSLELKVVAEGTGIAYQWEKWDNRESCFKPFVPSHSGVTGEKSPTLKFTTMEDLDNGMYRCVLNGQCGEELITDTCTVSVKGEPVILSGINVDRDICAGSGEFEFNVIARNSAGSGNLQYRWYKNTLSNRISQEADTLLNYYKLHIGPTGVEEGLYIVEVSNACGSVYDSAYLPVIVPPKIVEQSKDVKVCIGGDAEFYVKTNRDERYHYALYELTDYPSLVNRRKIAESYMNKFVLNGVTKGGYYQIKVYHPFCDSTFSNPMVLHLEYPITIDKVSPDTTLCAGETLTLRVDALTRGTEPLSYQWFRDGMPVSGVDSNEYRQLHVVYERDTVYYYCNVFNSCGTVRSGDIAVAVKRLPAISSGPELLPEYCEGDSLRAEVVLMSKASEVDSMRWFYQGQRLTDVAGHISGTTGLTLEIDSLRPGDGDGYYYLEVYNGCGVTQSNQVRFTLHELARFVKGLDGVRLLMCEGEKQVLFVQATGSEPIRYIWTQSGKVVADGYSNRLEVDASQLNKTEVFVCHIQNMCSKGGELTEAYITTSRPVAFDFSGGGTYCERDQLGVSACLQGSDTSVLYHLYRQPAVKVTTLHGRDVVPLTGPLCFSGIAEAGTYYVVAEDTNGCTAVMPGIAEVKENPLPEDFQLAILKPLCENTDSAEVKLTGTELDVVYQLCKYDGANWDTIRVAPWALAGTGAPFTFKLTEGEYKVVATNVVTGCVRDLSGALTIKEYEVPQGCDLSFWRDDSIYCRNAQSDVRLDQACFEAGHSYRLLKDGADFGTPVTVAPVHWTGLEEGVYSVKAVNSWGCETVYGNKEVKAQEPPARYTLIGKASYCRYDTDSSWIELEKSDLGVVYSFRYGSGTVYKEVAGTGGSIFLRVPLIERDYYVVAKDTTPERCEIVMYDTVELRMSRLEVTVSSPVYVNYGDTTVLDITVSGEVGGVTYKWEPADKLKTGHDVKEDPTTVPMTASTWFKVTVTDEASCPVTKEILVNVRGGDFTGGITDGGGNPVDTVQLCAGEMLDLKALVSGGACQSYTYSWSNEDGALAGGIQLNPVSPASDGKVYLHVECGNESVDDTVVVLVNPVVPVDTIEHAGQRCVAAGEPLTIWLKGSEPSAYYSLQSSPDGITWTEVANGVGTGNPLQFALADAAAYYGKRLRIVARMPHKTADGGYCETLMAGEVEVLQAPKEFPLSEGWVYCADTPVDSVIILKGSEQDIRYQLILLGSGVKLSEMGTGNALRFEPIEEPGRYVVQAVSGRCVMVMPDTVDVVENPVPEIWTGDCEYCDTEDSGCVVPVNRMENGVLYCLGQDTLRGPGSGAFGKLPAGVYEVVAENPETGCRSKDTVTVTEKPGPNVYAVVPGCYKTEEVFDLQTTGSDAGVDYFLYCDGTAVSSEAMPGTGSALHFGDQDVTGVYRVKAVAKNGCTADMRDSVIVYPPLPAFDAEVKGSFCDGDTLGVSLSLKRTAKGWKYYITNGFLRSDTLQRSDGGVLAWNKLNNGADTVSLLNGIYDFRAINPCGKDTLIGSVEVTGNSLPQKFPLVDKPLYYCAPETFTIALAGSEAGMKYIVNRYETNGRVETYPAVTGDGVTVPFVLGEFAQPGIYEIVADNGCPRVLEKWVVNVGESPEPCPIAGNDLCWQSDTDSLSVALSCRENGVDYYLYREKQSDAIKVDSLTSAWRPAPEMNFTKQSVLGCYYVEGVNTSTGCKREMEGRLCLNKKPAIYEVEPEQALGDTVVICRGVDSCIWLSGSEAGVGYELLRDGMLVNKVTGTGSRLNMGPITESGVYRVNAYVCGVLMKDSVIVKVLELPSLSLDSVLRYCEGTSDSLRVLAFTSDRLQYHCYRPDGTLLVQCNGNADGSSFRFPAAVDGEGYYVVEVVDEKGCKYADSTEVVMEHYPDAFHITSSDGEYICRGSYVRLGLDSSELDVRYQLRLASPMEEVSETEGTGSALVFPKQIKKAGTYYVTATRRTGLGCSVDFGSYTLHLADTILPFEVESVVNSYCVTSSVPQGSIRLSGSQVGLEYHLTRDGELVPGSEQTGDGGTLLWTGLEGKECNDFDLTDGYIYRVVARDPVSGCERTMFGSDTIVAASPIRIIAREPNNIEIEKCEGAEMKFSVTTTGCRTNYKWMRDGVKLKEGREPFYNIEKVQVSDYGEYECEITNSCGTVMSPKVTLMVRELVRLENPMPDEYVCDGNRRTVMFSSGFRNAETYTWYKLPDDVTEIGHRNFYELTDLQVADSGTYVVVGNNRCGVEVRDTACLIIGTVPAVSVSRVAVDTLCAGAYYATPSVTSATSFEWYLNGVKLNNTGTRYTIPAVSAADEGNYYVEVENACGKSVVPVSTLYVDDTLKVMSVSDAEMIRCPADGAVELSIDVAPLSERTKFLWQDKNFTTLGTESKLLVGPFAVNSYHTYRVWFMNKCSSGSHNFRDINIRVPDSIDVADPLRNVELCADCTTDTVLRLGINKTMMIEYKWYYRQTKEEETGLLLSTADTIRIPTCTQNTGYYYCHYFNRCESKTTETSWVRIDTVPVVRTELQNDTLCEEMSLRVELSATGGDLTYEWHALLKDGRDSVFDRNSQTPQSSTDYGMWHVVTRELDSALIWCRVYNSCGEDRSDTMLLRVYPKRELAMTPSVAMICAGDSVSLNVTLVTGTPAWEYTMRYPDGSEKTVGGISSRTHVLKVIQEGIYRIVSMKDADGCMLNSGLPEAEIQYNTPAELVMSGTQRVCLDDTVELHFAVTGGIGPWNIKVVDGLTKDLAPEICGATGLLLYGRDTVIRFPGEHSSEYSLNSIVDLGSGCNLRLQDSVITVKVDTPLYIRFSEGPWFVGQCHNVDLYTELKPTLSNGQTLPANLAHFFVNGKDRGVSGILPKEELRGDSCYGVYCEYTDSLGCKVRSDKIQVCIDSLPSGEIISSPIACASVASDFEIQLRPAGRIDSLALFQRRYKKGGAKDSILLSFKHSQIPSDGLFKLRLSWGDVGGADSCLVYEVMGIRDIHGCWMDYDVPAGMYRDTIWRHVDPKVDVLVRHSENSLWETGVHHVNLTAGDSVQVKVVLTEGEPLWSLPTLGMNSIVGMDTVFWLKDTGTYWFIPRDVACDRQGDAPWYDLTLTRLDTGYFRGKVFLEGVFDGNNMRMAWGNDCNWGRLRDSLRLPASLPLLPSGLEVIDWIEVELRISNGDPLDSVAVMADPSYFVTHDSCLVLSDGHLADRWTGDTLVGILRAYGGDANQRYVALRHRNHLGVMTNRLYRFVNKAHKGNAAYIDFTDTANIYHKGGPLNDINYHVTKKSTLGGKEFCLLAVGSLDSNYLVSLSDPNCVTLQDISPVQLQGYRYDLLHDINLDGCVDWPGWNGTTLTDWLFVERNRRKYSEIRWLDNK